MNSSAVDSTCTNCFVLACALVDTYKLEDSVGNRVLAVLVGRRVVPVRHLLTTGCDLFLKISHLVYSLHESEICF
jgi:hypothetical protein